METLLTGMLSKMGENGIGKIAESAGVDAGLAKTILEQGVPMLTSKMADNTKKEGGLDSLAGALGDHDGSVFDHIDDVVNPDVDTKGSKILGHILGSQEKDLESALAEKNGTDSSSVTKILEMAAPLVLGQLGSKQKEGGLDTAGIFDLLQGEKKETQNSQSDVLMGLATQFLDKDGDGSIVDDVIDLAGGFFGKK